MCFFQSRMVLVGHFGLLLGLFLTPRGLALLGWRGAGHLSPGAGEVPRRGCPQKSSVRPMAHGGSGPFHFRHPRNPGLRDALTYGALVRFA